MIMFFSLARHVRYPDDRTHVGHWQTSSCSLCTAIGKTSRSQFAPSEIEAMLTDPLPQLTQALTSHSVKSLVKEISRRSVSVATPSTDR